MTSRLMWAQRCICQSGPGACAFCHAAVCCENWRDDGQCTSPAVCLWWLGSLSMATCVKWQCWAPLCNVSFICVFYFLMRARRFVRRVNFPSRSSCSIVGINLSWAGNTSHVNDGMQHVYMWSNVWILVENMKPVVAVCYSSLFKRYLGLCNLRDKLSI